MVRLGKGKVKEESLRQELLQEKNSGSPEVQKEGNWPSQDVEGGAVERSSRRDSSVRVFVPTEAR